MYDWDVSITVTNPWPHAMWPVVQELYQFHLPIIIKTKELHLKTWHTEKDWKHA